MKLYLVSSTDDHRDDYCVCNAFVVAAESAMSALEFHPSGDKIDGDDWLDSLEDLKIKCIGISDSSVEKVILASFNAG